MPDISSLGIVLADIVAKAVARYPERGRLEIVDTMELHIGGHAANTTISISKLGLRSACISNVGDDFLGDFILQTLSRHNVDISGVNRIQGVSSSATMVLVHPDGERSFIHAVGTNATIKEDAINYEIIRNSKILYLAGFFAMPGFDGEPCARVLKRCKEEFNITTALDTVWDFWGNWMDLLAPCLPYVDYFMPSIEEAKMLSNKDTPEEVAETFIMRHGVSCVCLKMGAKGCYIKTKNIELQLPAYKVDVVDTTGAGDAHTAGFLSGLIYGWELPKIGKFANAVGALCVTAIGTTAGVRSLEETLEFMESAETLE